MIGTGSIILKGANIPDKCIVSAGSTVGKGSYSECSLITGNPAESRKTLDPDADFFCRRSGHVR